jgi:hypothetical protein
MVLDLADPDGSGLNWKLTLVPIRLKRICGWGPVSASYYVTLKEHGGKLSAVRWDDRALVKSRFCGNLTVRMGWKEHLTGKLLNHAEEKMTSSQKHARDDAGQVIWKELATRDVKPHSPT